VCIKPLFGRDIATQNTKCLIPSISGSSSLPAQNRLSEELPRVRSVTMPTHVPKMSLRLGKHNLKELTGIAVELGIELSTKPTKELLMRLIRNMYGEIERSRMSPNNTLVTFGGKKTNGKKYWQVPQEYLKRIVMRDVQRSKNPDPEMVELAQWALAKKNQQTYHKCVRRGKKIPVLCLERLAAAHCKDKWLPLEETEKCYSYCDQCRGGVLTPCQFQITSKTGAHTGAGYGLSCRCLAHSGGFANYEVTLGSEAGYEVANYRTWLRGARSHTVSEKPTFQEENTTAGSTTAGSTTAGPTTAGSAGGGPSGGGSSLALAATSRLAAAAFARALYMPFPATLRPAAP
jgi:hypothetical protein